jgi:hypothetical protein
MIMLIFMSYNASPRHSDVLYQPGSMLTLLFARLYRAISSLLSSWEPGSATGSTSRVSIHCTFLSPRYIALLFAKRSLISRTAFSLSKSDARWRRREGHGLSLANAHELLPITHYFLLTLCLLFYTPFASKDRGVSGM